MLSIVWSEPDQTWSVRVRGSGRSTYAARFSVCFSARGEILAFRGVCDCPVGHNCKHLVAALLVLPDHPEASGEHRERLFRSAPGMRADVSSPPASGGAAPRETRDEALPYDVEHWLDALAEAARASVPPPAAEGNARRPSKIRDCLLFVIEERERGMVRLLPYKARLQRDGGWRPERSPYPIDRLHKAARPQFVLQQDLELIDATRALGVPVETRTHPTYQDTVAPRRLAPRAALDLWPWLQELERTGRARWGGPEGPALVEAAPRPVVARWRELTDGRQRLQLEDPEGGQPLRVLHASPPIWVDPTSGAFGRAAGELTLSQLALLRSAPTLPGDVVNRVVSRIEPLKERVGDFLPVPRTRKMTKRSGVVPSPVLRLSGLAGKFRVHIWRWDVSAHPVIAPLLRLTFDYDGHEVSPGRKDPLHVYLPDEVLLIEPDRAAEEAALAALPRDALVRLDKHERYSFADAPSAAAWFIPPLEDTPWGASPIEDPAPALAFLLEEVPRLRAAGWRVEVDESWPYPILDASNAITASVGAAGEGLFDFGLTLRIEDQTVELAPILIDLLASLPRELDPAFLESAAFAALVRTQVRVVPLPEGRFAALDGDLIVEVARAFARHLGLFTRFHAGESAEVSALADALEGCGVLLQGVEEVRTLGSRLRALEEPASVEPPAPLQAQLRPYQKLGFGWLRALSETGFGGLLADDMGLGKTFRARIAQPIEKGGDARAQQWLNRRLRPFLLRRTKDDVALDLPPRTEITELVSLGPKQQALYEAVRVAMDTRVRDAIAARGLRGSHVTILDALLKMRQVCCDPSLLKDTGSGVGSAKRERLLEMLGQLVLEGRRVLVFSQFVQMLRLIEKDVQDRGWSYEWLSGDTRDRDEVVARFQSGERSIFLISLKAGGVGLTLTAADAVILYDPWWNPAVERQAMDRAHRIGQERAVFVYRLVAEGTVEEAILRLQSRKQALADALFEEGRATGVTFDADVIAELFQPMPEGAAPVRGG